MVGGGAHRPRRPRRLAAGGGGGGGLPDGSLGNLKSDLSAECQPGEDANQRDDCRIVAVVNSVQAYWEKRLRRYSRADDGVLRTWGRHRLRGGVVVGRSLLLPGRPGRLRRRRLYDDLRTRFGARGGPFAEAYVIAQEYGHYVENLRGVLDRARGAVDTGFIEELTEADIRDGVDAAAATGDDRIQQQARGQVSRESWTHWSVEQRQRWFLTGYRSTEPFPCDTFAVPTV